MNQTQEIPGYLTRRKTIASKASRAKSKKKLELVDYGVTFLPLTLQADFFHTRQLRILEGQLVLSFFSLVCLQARRQ